MRTLPKALFDAFELISRCEPLSAASLKDIKEGEYSDFRDAYNQSIRYAQRIVAMSGPQEG